MATRISDEEVEFCYMYGEQCRDFYGDISWELGVDRMQGGWLRVRGSCVLEWPEIAVFVRAGWNGAGGAPLVKDRRAILAANLARRWRIQATVDGSGSGAIEEPGARSAETVIETAARSTGR